MNNINKQKWETIVKYSPEHYKDGVYTKDEWTSILDICRTFDGKKLYLPEYLETETRYANTIVDIINHLKINEVILQQSYKRKTYLTLPYGNLPFNSSIDYINRTKSQSVIPVEQVPAIVRLSLRNWGYFPFYSAGHELAVDFGYDFYMYVHTSMDLQELNGIVRANKLFLNPRYNA